MTGHLHGGGRTGRGFEPPGRVRTVGSFDNIAMSAGAQVRGILGQASATPCPGSRERAARAGDVVVFPASARASHVNAIVGTEDGGNAPRPR